MRLPKILKLTVVAALAGALLWLGGRLLVGAIYRGTPWHALNALISNRAAHPLHEYLADYNRLYLHAVVPVLLLIVLLGAMHPRRRRIVTGLPGALVAAACQNRAAVIATLSLAFLSVMAGAWLAWSGSPLYRDHIEHTFNAASAVYQDAFRPRPLLGETDAWVRADQRPLQGLGVYDRARAQDGVTLVYGMQQAWLIDMDGTVLHRWSVNYDDLQRYSKDFIPRAYPETYVYWHQARLLPNGDLLVMIDQFDKSPSGLAMVKLDRDSHVLWVYPHHVHHDFNLDAQGNIYALDQLIRAEPVAGLQLEMPYLDEGVLVLSPDGKLRERFSLLDAFSGTEFTAFFNGASAGRHDDYLHTNNLDVLQPGQLGLGHPGLLLSFNGLSALATLDLADHRISRVWHGYWHQQHDPDLLDNGHIILFDNQGAWRNDGDARVIEFDPETYGIVWQYPGNTGQHLYSTYRGREQVLANDNVLISEFESGRLLEVTRAGQTVWEYSCPFRSDIDPAYVCNFVGGRRYRREELAFDFNGTAAAGERATAVSAPATSGSSLSR